MAKIRPDKNNANKGTERGRYMVEASLRETGAGRSILLDKADRIIAGNKTFEAATDIGLPVRVVETDGTELVAVKRTDLDLSDTTGTARKLAYYDNRASEVGLEWDAEQVLADIGAGLDLSAMFFDFELDKLLGRQGEEFDPAKEWQGMPEFEQEDLEAWKSVKVNFANEADLVNFAALVGQTVTKNTRSIWYPKKEKLDLTQYKVIGDES